MNATTKRTTRQLLIATLVAAALAVTGTALASHATLPTPEQNGLLVAHSAIDEVPVSSVARATMDGAEVSIQFARVPSGFAGGWHTHPGPVFVTVVEGEITVERPHGNACSSETYTAGQGFVDEGLGAVHRASSSTGAAFYATYLLPPGSALMQPAEAPAACS